jgi:hypothetical protein
MTPKKMLPYTLLVFCCSLAVGGLLGGNLARASASGDDRPVSVSAALSEQVYTTTVEVDLPEWAEDRLLVAPADGYDLEAIASDYRVEVLREMNRSGYGVLGLPPTTGRDAFMNRLGDDQRVRDVTRQPATQSPLDGMVSAELDD